MKQYITRAVLILASIGLSIYFLYPTYSDYANNKKIEQVLKDKEALIKQQNPSISREELSIYLSGIKDSLKRTDPDAVEARKKRIKLGLDLQGGMRVVLEVNTVELLRKLANNVDKQFETALSEASKEAATNDENVVDIFTKKLQDRGIRLSKYFGTIRQEDGEIIAELKQKADDAVDRGMEIIRNRIDQYGVSEPSIARQGARRIIVELPGISNEEEARQLLQGTALLEFRLVKDPQFAVNTMLAIDNVLAGKAIVDTTATSDTTKSDSTDVAQAADTTAKATDTASTAKVDTGAQTPEAAQEKMKQEHPFFALAMVSEQTGGEAYVSASNKPKIERILKRDDVKRVIPNNVEFVFFSKPVAFQEGEAIYQMILVNKNPELTGGVITDAIATIDPNSSAAIVSMEMNAQGSTEWARITGANIDKRCAIMLDGAVFSAPVIRSRISGGRSQIEGMENLEEAKLLEIVLKAGALPAPVDIIEERTVGPSLGQDSINQGLNSAIYGYVIVALFMMVYYVRSGMISAFALALTMLFIVGVLAAFQATLTLPGIAGIVLTIGMAVDANVLIFERIREEIDGGRTMKAAIESGFSKASSAIWDSNLTTILTSIILYQFGSGPVQGFALTLMIGIGASLFSALVITRLVMDAMNTKGIKVTIG